MTGSFELFAELAFLGSRTADRTAGVVAGVMAVAAVPVLLGVWLERWSYKRRRRR